MADLGNGLENAFFCRFQHTNMDATTMKKLTFKDLNRDELLEIVEAVVDSMPEIKNYLTEEVIAGAIRTRKIKELRRINKSLEPLIAAEKRARSERSRLKIARQAHPFIKRAKRLVHQIEELEARIKTQKEARK